MVQRWTTRKESISNDWEIASLELSRIEGEMQIRARNVVDMINRRDWLTAILDDDQKANES